MVTGSKVIMTTGTKNMARGMNIRISRIAVLVLCLALAVPAMAQWVQLGPDGGDVRTLTRDPHSTAQTERSKTTDTARRLRPERGRRRLRRLVRRRADRRPAISARTIRRMGTLARPVFQD